MHDVHPRDPRITTTSFTF